MSKLINIGFGNTVNTDKIVAVVSPDAAPIKRMVQAAKEDRSTNTNENLKYSLALLEKELNKKPEELRIGIVTNGFHVFRGTSIGKKMGCRQIEGVPAKSNKFLQLNYLVRECLGIWKDKLVGNL